LGSEQLRGTTTTN